MQHLGPTDRLAPLDDRRARLLGALLVVGAIAVLLATVAWLPDEPGNTLGGGVGPLVPHRTTTARDGEAQSSGSDGSLGPTASGIVSLTAGASAPPKPRATRGPTLGPTLGPTAPPASKPTPRPTVKPTPKPTSAPAACPLFPSDNVWNEPVSSLPVAADSAAMISAIGLTAALHPDFSSLAWNGGRGYGIPYNVASASTPTYTVSFDYADQSDPGPYPIPSNPKIEGGSDRHLLLWDTQDCTLSELYDAVHTSSGWIAGSGAIWNLRSNALRPKGWTSADAAGLPILPGLARYSEVAAGAIRHALRFTAPDTCAGYIYPARHEAGSGSCSVNPPMGLRVRLNASVNISGFPPQARVILAALKTYGMILADNGSPWYVTGAPNANWNDDDLHTLGQLDGSDFEVVNTSGFVNG